MIKKYVANVNNITITPIEVIRETNKYVYLEHNGEEFKEPKESTFNKWFDSYDDAYNYLIENKMSLLNFYKDLYIKYINDIEEVIKLKINNGY